MKDFYSPSLNIYYYICIQFKYYLYMKIVLSTSLISSLGKSTKVKEAIEKLEDVEFISKESNMKESLRVFSMILNNDIKLDTTRNSLNYLIAKHKLKGSVITITN